MGDLNGVLHYIRNNQSVAFFSCCLKVLSANYLAGILNTFRQITAASLPEYVSPSIERALSFICLHRSGAALSLNFAPVPVTSRAMCTRRSRPPSPAGPSHLHQPIPSTSTSESCPPSHLLSPLLRKEVFVVSPYPIPFNHITQMLEGGESRILSSSSCSSHWYALCYSLAE